MEECRRVGSRLVLKGQAEVCVLYRGENQELAAYRTALPFSQLLDGVELPEGAETEARIQWASSEIRVLRTENGPAFGITVTVCAVLLVRRKQQVSYIEDLYSLHHAAQVRRQETPLPVAWQRDTPSQEAVQQLEFGQGRPFAYLTAAECSGVSTVQEGGGPALRCTVRLRVLYLDESGTPVCAERSAEVTAPAAWEPQTVRAACGLPQMQITGSTMAPALSDSTMVLLARICSALSFLLMVVRGMYGKWLYRKSAAEKIKRIRAEFPDAAQRKAVLAAQGGVSIAAVFGCFLLLMVVGSAATLLLGPNVDALINLVYG